LTGPSLFRGEEWGPPILINHIRALGVYVQRQRFDSLRTEDNNSLPVASHVVLSTPVFESRAFLWPMMEIYLVVLLSGSMANG
jgi:hypothetical protein